jgi:3-oxoacyl-[acyl-carrier-protein] synthase-3
VHAKDIPLEILGTGEYIPAARLSSEDLDRRWMKPQGWSQSRTGVISRAYAGADETVVVMGAAAAARALDAAGTEAAQLDAIICVGSVPYQAIPCTAAFLQRALGLESSGIPAFDVNATCLGFLAALDLVAQSIATGRYRTVLIVASECVSLGLHTDDHSTAALFGDGAGAVVVGAARRNDAVLRSTHMQTFSAGANFCQIRAGGSGLSPRENADDYLQATAFEMRGRETFRLALQLLPQFLSTLLDRARIDARDIDVWVPHQASAGAIEHLQRLLDLPADRFITTIDTLGNQVSASLPIALHRGISTGKIKTGQTIALVGSGAGVSFGGAVLRI